MISGIGELVKVIGEVGLAHEGSLGLALSYVDAIAAAGASAAKFQMHISSQESSIEEPFRTIFSKQDSTRFDYWNRTSFESSEWKLIQDRCLEREIEFICTPFSGEAFLALESMGVRTIKLGSGDFTNRELLEMAAQFPGNVILSTGMATYQEIERTLAYMLSHKEKESLTLMHCTSMYPCPSDYVSLDSIVDLRERYGVEIGFSDHSGEYLTAIGAIARGAAIIEVHVTFDRAMFGVDSPASITFSELSEVVRFANLFPQMNKAVSKDVVAEKLESLRFTFGRSLSLKKLNRKGHVLSESDFCLRKPGGGLDWDSRHDLVGKRLREDFDEFRLLRLEDAV